MDTNKNASWLKTLGVLLLLIFGLWLVYSLLMGSGNGFNASFSVDHGGGHFNMGYGYGVGFAGTLSVILLFLIKLLFVLFVVGLVIGIGVAVKNYIFTPADVEKIKSTFTGKKTVVIKETCEICGKELESDWKVCPHCGKELNSKSV